MPVKKANITRQPTKPRKQSPKGSKEKSGKGIPKRSKQQLARRIRLERSHFTQHIDKIDAFLGITITEGRQGPPELFSDEERQALRETLAKPEGEALEHLFKKVTPYVPSDPARPWRDAYVRTCAQRFLRDVVLSKWVKNHPHKPCSNIRVDEWGRTLCRWINPNNGVNGPWENPTHFLFYAYNTYQAYVDYGITLNGFLKAFCDVALP